MLTKAPPLPEGQLRPNRKQLGAKAPPLNRGGVPKGRRGMTRN